MPIDCSLTGKTEPFLPVKYLGSHAWWADVHSCKSTPAEQAFFFGTRKSPGVTCCRLTFNPPLGSAIYRATAWSAGDSRKPWIPTGKIVIKDPTTDLPFRTIKYREPITPMARNCSACSLPNTTDRSLPGTLNYQFKNIQTLPTIPHAQIRHLCRTEDTIATLKEVAVDTRSTLNLQFTNFPLTFTIRFHHTTRWSVGRGYHPAS